MGRSATGQTTCSTLRKVIGNPDPDFRTGNPNLLIEGILMQAPAADAVGVGENIATGYTSLVDAPSLLNEVYRNRCIELYL